MKHIVALLLVVVAPAAFPQPDPTVVVFDLSYSMSLVLETGETRKEALLGALEDRLDPDSRSYALILFQDHDELVLALPYPATGRRVVEEIKSAVPWGRSPVVEATRFALEVATLVPGADVLVVTDAEDDGLYLTPDQPAAIPELLLQPGNSLSVITLSRQSAGVAAALMRWANESGGDVVELSPGSPQTALVQPGVSGHEIETLHDLQAENRSERMTFVSAWLLVAQWNLLAAFLAGVVAIVFASERGRRRRNHAVRHNNNLTELVLEVKTTLRRFEHSFTTFPVSVGTGGGHSLKLELSGSEELSFLLEQSEDGLEFSSDAKLNVNGVARTRWTLTQGDQVRFGKYRVSVSRYVQKRPLPMPPRITWQQPVLASAALALFAAAFFVRPIVAERARPGAGATASAEASIVEPAELPAPSGDFQPVLPTIFTRSEGFVFFDADYLLIHAHPDDETLDNGVLLSRLNAAGLAGAVLLLTDGQSGIDQYPEREVGGPYPAYDLRGEQLLAVRVQEAQRALAHLGVGTYLRGELANHPYNSITDQLTPYQVLQRWGGSQAAAELATVIEGFSPELLISPDGPHGPYEHFEHEATGLLAKQARGIAQERGTTIQAHIMAVDPLQTQHYSSLIQVSPWDTHPASGRTYRWHQMQALLEHKTQRDASSVGIETRLAVASEYYAVEFWNDMYLLPEQTGLVGYVETSGNIDLNR